MADAEDSPERSQCEGSQNTIKIEPIRSLTGNVVGSGLVRTISPAGRIVTTASTAPTTAPVIVQAAPVAPNSFHHHVQTVAKPVTRISTVLPGSSCHVPRGAAQVASLAPPRASVTSTMMKAAAAAGTLQPITVTPHHPIQSSMSTGPVVGRPVVQSANYAVSGSTSQATVSVIPRHQVKSGLPSPTSQGGVSVSRVSTHVRPGLEAPSRPVVLQTTTTHKQIGDKGGAVVKGIPGSSGRVVTGGRVTSLSGLPPMVPLSNNSSAVLVGGTKSPAPPPAPTAAVLVPTKMTPGGAVVKGGAVLVGGKGSQTGVQQAAVLVAGGGKAPPPPRHPSPLPPATLHQSAIITTSALITRPVMIASGSSSQGGTIVRSGVVAPHSKYPTTMITQPELPPSAAQPVFIQHKPHIVGGGSNNSTIFPNSSANTGQSSAIIHPQPAPPPLVHSGTASVPVIPAVQSSTAPAATTYPDSRRPPTPHQPSVQPLVPTQVSGGANVSGGQRYQQGSGHVMVVDTKRPPSAPSQTSTSISSVPPLQLASVIPPQPEQGVNEGSGSVSALPLSLTPKQMTSPRPSILRKRDPEGWSPVKVQKNLTPVLTSLSVTTCGSGEDESTGHAAGSGGSSTLSAASSPGEDAPVLALAAPATPPPEHPDERVSLDVSPRKKPRKQQLPQNNQTSEPSAFSDEEMEFISHDNNSVTQHERTSDYYEEQEKRKRMTLWRGKHYWKPPNSHFMRYTDVKPKEEKRLTLTELASQKHALSKINGWKIYHLLSQVEDIANSENEYLNLYSDILMDVEVKQKKMKGREHDSKNAEILSRISERIKANSARCKVVKDHMDEAKTQIMKLFEHKAYVSDLINKCANKRALKKRERL